MEVQRVLGGYQTKCKERFNVTTHTDICISRDESGAVAIDKALHLSLNRYRSMRIPRLEVRMLTAEAVANLFYG